MPSLIFIAGFMKKEIEDKVREELADWEYLKELPQEMSGFHLTRYENIYDDFFEFLSYENREKHRRLVMYFHQETMEYKLKVGYGLTEFCRIDCIAPSREEFQGLLQRYLEEIIRKMAAEKVENIGSFVLSKHIMDYDFGDLLPEELEGFQLYIRPSAPVPITNFSYIIIDYECFELESNVIIYYNVFRDEFFGEARICRIPTMSYQFDSNTLEGLAEKLRLHLASRLRSVKEAALQEIARGK